jgi:hypothetical protein
MWRLLSLLFVVGCAQARPAIIRSEPFDFGGVRATVRAFPGDAICEAEPRFLLDELSSVNGLLSRFLGTAPSRADAEWTDPALALVEEAVERLPALVQLHQRNLDSLGRCEFATQGAWPPLVVRGRELLERTRALLAAAPDLLQTVRNARALADWRRERLVQQQSARRTCPVRLGSAIIYFAWREAGRTTWLFCDGAEVHREGDGKPRLEGAAVEFTRGRRPSEATYFTAVGRYPASAVAAPPGDEGALSAW